MEYQNRPDRTGASACPPVPTPTPHRHVSWQERGSKAAVSSRPTTSLQGRSRSRLARQREAALDGRMQPRHPRRAGDRFLLHGRSRPRERLATFALAAQRSEAHHRDTRGFTEAGRSRVGARSPEIRQKQDEQRSSDLRVAELRFLVRARAHRDGPERDWRPPVVMGSG